MSKKKLLSLSLVTMMIATLSFSTLAWFTDDDSATNDFTVGGAGTGDSNDIFSVDVKENVDGEEGEQIVDNWDFENILPGDNHKKEAYIENTGSYEQYVRVVMTITDWYETDDIITIKMDEKFAENWKIAEGGITVNDNGELVRNYTPADANGNLVVTLYLKHKLQPNEKIDIMDYVKISQEATQADFISANFANGFQILFDADAAQTQNVLKTYGDVEWENAKDTFAALGI